jgi:hypothetical protein
MEHREEAVFVCVFSAFYAANGFAHPCFIRVYLWPEKNFPQNRLEFAQESPKLSTCPVLAN